MNRGALGFGKMQFSFPLFDAPNIALVGRDVEIAAQQNVARFIAGFIETFAAIFAANPI